MIQVKKSHKNDPLLQYRLYLRHKSARKMTYTDDRRHETSIAVAMKPTVIFTFTVGNKARQSVGKIIIMNGDYDEL